MGTLYKMLGYPTGLKKDNASDRNIKGPQYSEGGEIASESESEEKEDMALPQASRVNRSAFLYSDPHAAIYFLRHGPTAYNAENGGIDRVRGWADIPLTDKGTAAALKAATYLKANCKIDVIVCCDLGRTVATAQIAATTLGIPISQRTGDLRPWNLGSFQGKPVDETFSQVSWYANHEKAVVPQGESLEAFKNRFLDYMSAIDKRYPGKRVLVVTHSRNVSMYNAWLDKGLNRKREINTDIFLDIKGQPKPGEVEPVEYTMLDQYAQCRSCKMFIQSKGICSLQGMDVKIKPTMSCGLYSYGQADESEMDHVSSATTPTDSGLVDRKVRCENCMFFDEDESDCELFESLNQGQVFSLKETVDKHGCCNAQTPKPKS
jgi:broad specificity phosphatase PhoE